MTDVTVRHVTRSDRLVVDRLFQLFAHDVSEFQGGLPGGSGHFPDSRVEYAFGDPAWAGYLLTSGETPVGFSFVRALDQERRVVNSLFVVRALRRRGVGLAAALEVAARHPGKWEVALQSADAGAVAFWRRVAAAASRADRTAWSEEWDSPDRPGSPPDVWISFETV